MNIKLILIAVALLVLSITSCSPKNDFKKISLQEYRSKMKAGWLGQMAGVGWGAPTEFKYTARIIPEDEVPNWQPEMINQHYQDDIYVEMTFLKTLQDYGFDVSIRQAGIDFANSGYMLWHANNFGRQNLRAGIAPPYSSHPKYNSHADDIDYQIEADYSGLISPGMPQMVIDLGKKFGRLMNYGDGVYGGIFVGAMYAEAFFETDINRIIKAGLASIPAQSQYAEAIRDVIAWHKENPTDWQSTWQRIEDKYNLNPEYRKFSCSGTNPEFNIDAKINGAYIVMGLLYGQGDMDKTIITAMRGGQDSDCNPSNAAGILATSLGLEKLPQKFKVGIDDTTKFSYTAYDFPSLLSVCEELARKAVLHSGGKIEKNASGVEEFLIPEIAPVIPQLQQCWQAEDITEDVNYSAEEMARIVKKARKPEELVNKWLVAGPFAKKGVDGLGLFDIKFGPELNDNFDEWKIMPVGTDGYEVTFVNLERYFGVENSAAYLKTKVWIDKAQKAFFEIGSDDGVKLWLNGRLVHQNNTERGHNQADDVVEVSLKKGWNSILMKITQGVGGWGASLAITDLQHEPMQGLKFEL